MTGRSLSTCWWPTWSDCGVKILCILLLAGSVRWPEAANVKAYTVQFRTIIAIGFFEGGTDTDCVQQQQHQQQHTPLSNGDASPRQGHGQLLVRVVSTLEWWRNPSTAGFTQLKPERRSTKSALSDWTRGLPNPAGMGRCSLRVRKAPSGAASSADRGPASPPGDPDRRRKTPAIGNYRISSTMRWRDRGAGRSSTTLMCKSCPHVDSVVVAFSFLFHSVCQRGGWQGNRWGVLRVFFFFFIRLPTWIWWCIEAAVAWW